MYSLHLPDDWSPLTREGVRPMPLVAARRRATASPAGGSPWPGPAAGLEAAARATLDKLNRGVFLVTASGNVGFANRAGRAMLGRGGLAVKHGRLEFADAEVQERFATFLAESSDADGGPSLVLRVQGPRQRGAWRVLVSALDIGSGGSGAAYSVFVYEPDAGQRPLPAKVLRALYGLSPAEARLANELFVGRSVQEAAAALGVTVNTARSTLKRVFGKCAVGSQAELLQLLALGPRTL